jgi:parvulin-like peptidyl-prolyl isomerase
MNSVTAIFATDRKMLSRAMALLLKGSIIALLWILANAGGGRASEADKVVVIVNGQELRTLHFNRVMSSIMPMARIHGGVTEEKKAAKRKEAIDRLIDEELLYQEAKKEGIRPDRKAVKAALANSIKESGGKKKFKEAMTYYGITESEFRRILGKPGMIKELLDRRVDKRVGVDDSVLIDYYEKNKESHFTVNKRRFRHIFFKADPGMPSSWDVKKEKAEDILDRIRNGVDFAEMARSFSEGVRKESGGDTGFINKKQFLSGLAEVGWKMKPGEVSDVIRTMYGFHIIRLEEDPISEVMTFEEAKRQIEPIIVSKQKSSLKKELMDGLHRNASIKVVDE